MDQFNFSFSGGIVVDFNFECCFKEFKEVINNFLEKVEKLNLIDCVF